MPTSLQPSVAVPQLADLPLASGGQAVRVGAQPKAIMAVPIAGLSRLSDGDLVFIPQPTQFLSIAHDTLGNFGEATDGFDLVLSTPMNAFAADVAALSELDQHLLDMDFRDGDFGSAAWTPVGDAMQSFTASGDTILGVFNNTIGPPDTGGGPPPPPPPDTGGGPPPQQPPPQPAPGPGPDITCSLLVNPLTHEVVGTACQQVGPPGDTPPPDLVFKGGGVGRR